MRINWVIDRQPMCQIQRNKKIFLRRRDKLWSKGMHNFATLWWLLDLLNPSTHTVEKTQNVIPIQTYLPRSIKIFNIYGLRKILNRSCYEVIEWCKGVHNYGTLLVSKNLSFSHSGEAHANLLMPKISRKSMRR